MATSSFLNRWSKRKLEQASDRHSAEQQTHEPDLLCEESSVQALQAEGTNQAVDTDADSSSAEEKTQEASIANLLISEASESVKKAALRKLFLSEEFNVRDGLDDYDDDYSNLKSLSEGVADTLRDWIKEKSEEEPVQEQQTVKTENEQVTKELSDLAPEGEENLDSGKVLYKNTVAGKLDTSELNSTPELIGQNRPDQK